MTIHIWLRLHGIEDGSLALPIQLINCVPAFLIPGTEFFKFFSTGQGSRCDDPEIYREDILWGIKHAFAYDAQCEGTRGGYLFSLIEQFNDWSDFCELAANRANKNVKDRGQKIWHYSQIGCS